MDRRGFLGRLLSGLAVAATAPALDLFHVPSVAAAEASGLVIPTYAGAFRALVADALTLLREELPWNSYLLVKDARIGDGPLTAHYSIEMLARDSDDMDRDAFRERFLRPAMASLAHRASDVSAFGILTIPTMVEHGAVMTDTAHGVSLRGLRDYSLQYESERLLFDVVCG